MRARMARARARCALRALAPLLVIAALARASAAGAASAVHEDVLASLTAEEAPGGVVITVGLAESNVSSAVASVIVEYERAYTQTPAAVLSVLTLRAGDAPPLKRLQMERVPELHGGWRATVPKEDAQTGALTPGALVRYAVTALDVRGAELARRPSSVDADGQRIFKGYVVGWRAIAAQSAVPALYWYVDDAERARGDEATPGSLAFDAGDGQLRYYDQVDVHRQGSGRHDGDVRQINAAVKSKDWAKRKFEVHFLNKRFAWSTDAPTVRRISLRSMFKESGPVSYMREALALRLLNDIGVPSQQGKYVRLFQNGTFYGLYLMVEQIDKAWLNRQRMPPDTMLLKAQHWMYSNLRAPDLRLECPQTTPDQNYNPGPGHGRGVGCPMVYQVITPKAADKWDRSHDTIVNSFTMSIQNVADRVYWAGTNDSFVKGFWELRVNVSQVVTEMAAQTLMLNIDRCTKNHVYAHFKGSDRWAVIPMDLEDSFATDSRDGYRSCAAEGYPCKDAYCYLSCPQFNTIFMCDKDHPQDFDHRSTYNHLTSAVLWNPETKALYITKLKELLNKYNNNTRSWLEEEVYNIKKLIEEDAREDAQRWGTGSFDSGVDALLGQIKQRRTQLYSQLQ